jgi:transaldolase
MMARSADSVHPASALAALGQSLWLDYIHRELLDSGELRRLIEQDGIRGVTSNPTIFEQAITKSAAYDADIAALAREGRDARGIFEALAVADVARAADTFRPIHEMTGGGDGFVSLEVSPDLARDTAATVAEARRLWAAVDRPNLMVKVPGTPEGLPAIGQLIAEGVNVNVTLLFAVGMYERVIDAYLTGLERRRASGAPLDAVRSVASFFVSRVDSDVDPQLERRIAAAADPAERSRLEGLLGTAAVDNAVLAYQVYEAAFAAPRFRALMAAGAAVQRPLWASTSTKNPRYPDTMYVDRLIGPDTVNTVPPATLRAFQDHGRAVRTIDADVAGARSRLAAIEAAGISLRAVTDHLEEDGVAKFTASFRSLLAAIDAKRARAAAR